MREWWQGLTGRERMMILIAGYRWFGPQVNAHADVHKYVHFCA